MRQDPHPVRESAATRTGEPGGRLPVGVRSRTTAHSYGRGCETNELALDTTGRHIVDLTDAVADFCRDRGDGLLSVFAPHATAGLALFELGAGSEDDLE